MSIKNSIASIAILFTLIAIPVLACKVDLTARNYSSKALVEYSSTIVIAKVKAVSPAKNNGFNQSKKFDYEMEVVTSLKGSKKLKKFILSDFDSSEVSDVEVGPGVDCFNHGGFQKADKYLIFVDSVSPKGYRKIQGTDDPWLLEVKKYLRKK